MKRSFQNLIQKKSELGDTLLNAIKVGGSYKNSVVSVTLYESKKLLSQMLGAICLTKSNKE